VVQRSDVPHSSVHRIVLCPRQRGASRLSLSSLVVVVIVVVVVGVVLEVAVVRVGGERLVGGCVGREIGAAGGHPDPVRPSRRFRLRARLQLTSL
jgi:hypothetical protein